MTAQFLDDFTNWLPDQYLQMNNNIVLGDFNIDVNKIDSDENANIFMVQQKLLVSINICNLAHINVATPLIYCSLRLDQVLQSDPVTKALTYLITV